jgi:hypothetical protein
VSRDGSREDERGFRVSGETLKIRAAMYQLSLGKVVP